MQYLKYKVLLLILIPVFIACQDSVNNSELNDSEWLIPASEVYDGGPGKDGIPAISRPTFLDNKSINFMKDKDLIIGIKVGNQVRGYPHPILNWHEIINDQINEINFSITYCPLTGSTIGINREIDGNITTFGVSGLLYNSNLIPYDRATNSNWSQMKMQCVNGKLKGTVFNFIQTFETDWKTWKETFPESQVVSTSTGYNREYQGYPYGTYREDESLFFPVSNLNADLPFKERVHGIIENDQVYAFRFHLFENKTTLLQKKIGGKNYLIIGSKENNFIISFYNTIGEGTELNFEVIENSLPIILTDNEGNKWDVFGFAVEGKRKGQRLTSTKSFISYWFSWNAFYQNVSIIN